MSSRHKGTEPTAWRLLAWGGNARVAAIGLLVTVGCGATVALLGLTAAVLTPDVPSASTLYWVHAIGDGVASASVLIDPDQLLKIQADPDAAAAGGYIPSSFRGSPDSISLGGRVRFVSVAQCDSEMFTMLGDRMAMGLPFGPADDSFLNDNYQTVVIGWNLWQGWFHGDVNIIGKSLTFRGWPFLNGTTLRIIAVMQQNSLFPGQPDLWIPLPRYNHQNIPRDSVQALVRLRPGVGVKVASLSFEARLGGSDHRRVALVPLLPGLLGPLVEVAGTTIAACVALFLIVGLDVFGLGLLQARQQSHANAVHIALGATPLRLLRSRLHSSWPTLAIAATGTFGVYTAAYRVLEWFAASHMPSLPTRPAPFLEEGLAAAAAAVLLLLLLQVLPAAAAPWRNPFPALAASDKSGPLRKGYRTIPLLLAAFVCGLATAGCAIAFASLLSFRRSSEAIGIEPNHLYTAYCTLPRQVSRGYVQLGNLLLLPELSIQRRDIPAVLGAAAFLPGAPGPIRGDIVAGAGVGRVSVNEEGVSPGFFAAVGLSVLSGRYFTPAEMADEVGNRPGQPIVVDLATATDLGLTPTSAIGASVRNPGSRDYATIIGVVSDIHLGLDQLPTVYVPIADIMPPNGAQSFFLLLRSNLSRSQLAHVLASVVGREAGLRLTFGPVEPFSASLPAPYHLAQLSAVLGVLLAILALGSVATVSFESGRLMLLSDFRSNCIRVALGAPVQGTILRCAGPVALAAVSGSVAAGAFSLAFLWRIAWPGPIAAACGSAITSAGLICALGVVGASARALPDLLHATASALRGM